MTAATLALLGCAPEPLLIPPSPVLLEVERVTEVQPAPGLNVYEVGFVIHNASEVATCLYVTERVWGEGLGRTEATMDLAFYVAFAQDPRTVPPEDELLVEPVWAFEDNKDVSATVRLGPGEELRGAKRATLDHRTEAVAVTLASGPLLGTTVRLGDCGPGGGDTAEGVRLQSAFVPLPR